MVYGSERSSQQKTVDKRTETVRGEAIVGYLRGPEYPNPFMHPCQGGSYRATDAAGICMSSTAIQPTTPNVQPSNQHGNLTPKLKTSQAPAQDEFAPTPKFPRCCKDLRIKSHVISCCWTSSTRCPVGLPHCRCFKRRQNARIRRLQGQGHSTREWP